VVVSPALRGLADSRNKLQLQESIPPAEYPYVADFPGFQTRESKSRLANNEYRIAGGDNRNHESHERVPSVADGKLDGANPGDISGWRNLFYDTPGIPTVESAVLLSQGITFTRIGHLQDRRDQ
jgi:hypothetical protein